MRPPVRPLVLGCGLRLAEATRWGMEALTVLKVPRTSMSMTDLKAGKVLVGGARGRGVEGGCYRLRSCLLGGQRSCRPLRLWGDISTCPGWVRSRDLHDKVNGAQLLCTPLHRVGNTLILRIKLD